MRDTPTGPRPIVIRLCVGDFWTVIEVLAYGVRRRCWGPTWRTLRGMPQKWKGGHWRPWTIGDMIVHRRRREWMFTWPRDEATRPFWRHAPVRADGRNRRRDQPPAN